MERWVRSLSGYRAELGLLLALVLSSGASVFLVALRAAYTHRLAYRFLIWNLILAWIPLGCAALVRELDGEGTAPVHWRWGWCGCSSCPTAHTSSPTCCTC